MAIAVTVGMWYGKACAQFGPGGPFICIEEHCKDYTNEGLVEAVSHFIRKPLTVKVREAPFEEPENNHYKRFHAEPASMEA